jgi:iron complex transport system ATP-binding protein
MQKGLGITVDDVSWSVKQKKQKILYPLSFELSPGKILGVVGPNGAGKSTLLRLLYRYYKPTTGKVKINGIDIWKLTSRQVACSVATVLQENFSDFSLTVREIVTLGRTPYSKWLSNSNSKNDKKIVQSSIDRLSLNKFENRHLNTLSGGERQRVMIARALAQEPDILILDEPTNHLDIRQQLEILNLLKDLSITVITSLHDLNMARSNCDEILLLKDGCALGFGKPNLILSESNISEAFRVKACHELLTPSNSKQITFHLH